MDKVKNFSKTFDTMRNITVITIVLFALTQAAWLYAYFKKDAEVGKRVFVVTDNGTFRASDKSEESIDQFEARNFIRVFMDNMFAHDGASFKRNIEFALNMINKKDGMQIYTEFKKGQVLETYIKYDSRSRIEVDSISLNMDVRPIEGVVYAKQYTVYAGKEMMQPLGAKFTLDRIDRSDKKPYGLLISSFSFVNYNPAPQEQNPETEIMQETEKQMLADSLVNKK